MFNLIKRTFAREPSKIIQIAYYLVYLQDEFDDRGRYFTLNSMKLSYALFIMDMEHRAKHGRFLFEGESKTFGWHGFYYHRILSEFGWLINPIIYTSFDGEREHKKFKYLTSEEKKQIEDFLENHYMILYNCIFSGDEQASLLSEETQTYLKADKFPFVHDDILEEYFINLTHQMGV